MQSGVRVQHEEEPLGGSSRGARPDMRPQLWGAASAGSRVGEGQSSPGSAAVLLGGEALEQPWPAGLQGRWSGGGSGRPWPAPCWPPAQGLGVSLWSFSATHGRCRTDSVSQDGAGATWSPAGAVNVSGGLRSKDEGGPSRAGGTGLGWTSGVGEVMGLHLCFLGRLAPPGWVWG